MRHQKQKKQDVCVANMTAVQKRTMHRNDTRTMWQWNQQWQLLTWTSPLTSSIRPCHECEWPAFWLVACMFLFVEWEDYFCFEFEKSENVHATATSFGPGAYMHVAALPWLAYLCIYKPQLGFEPACLLSSDKRAWQRDCPVRFEISTGLESTPGVEGS
jgi:hypothetical protein